MKKLYTILVPITIGIILSANVFLPRQAFAQAPQKMSYQAVIRDADGNLVTDKNVEMRISIKEDTEDGYVVYTEIQTPETNANGLVSFEIGYGEGFNKIDWSAGPYLLIIETDPKGGSNYTITGSSQFSSVPYALHAQTAENITGTVTESQNLNDVLTQNNSAGNKNITNLATPVNPQDATTKAYVDDLLTQIKTLQNQLGIIKDVDGNLYTTVKIGTQVWIGENLKTTSYNDGTAIPLVADNTAWSNLTTPGYCWYNNDAATYKNTYGALYNWYTVNTDKLCPTGWHVPNDAEWATLTSYLGGESVAGGKLKETGTAHWTTPNSSASNETSFTALPGGFRSNSGTFHTVGTYGYWWSSTAYNAPDAWYCNMETYNGNLRWTGTLRYLGFSVRCVRDN